MQSLVKQFWKSTAAITMLLAAGCGVLDDSYVAPDVCPMPTILEAVSYTHLTLPTILRV